MHACSRGPVPRDTHFSGRLCRCGHQWTMRQYRASATTACVTAPAIVAEHLRWSRDGCCPPCTSPLLCNGPVLCPQTTHHDVDSAATNVDNRTHCGECGHVVGVQWHGGDSRDGAFQRILCSRCPQPCRAWAHRMCCHRGPIGEAPIVSCMTLHCLLLRRHSRLSSRAGVKLWR